MIEANNLSCNAFHRATKFCTAPRAIAITMGARKFGLVVAEFVFDQFAVDGQP